MSDKFWQQWQQWQQATFDRVLPLLRQQGHITESDRIFRTGIDDEAILDSSSQEWHRAELCEDGELLIHGFGAYPLSFKPDTLEGLQSWEDYQQTHEES